MPDQISEPRDAKSTQVLFQQYVNEGELEKLLELYEPNATLLKKDGEVVCDEGIREHLVNLLRLNPRFKTKVIKEIPMDGVALLFSEWQLNGTLPDGKPITATGKSFDVVRRQPDGTWRIAFDNPHGIVS